VDKQEAREILNVVVSKLRQRGYDDLRATLLGDLREVRDRWSLRCALPGRIRSVRDAEEDGPLRVFALIDDGVGERSRR
jgi:hypothetical protein